MRNTQVSFTNSCHFTNLDFNQDQFIQCAFARSLLEKVNISTSLWQRNDCSEIHATELKLDNVDASGSDFVNAYLINSNIQQCQLKQSNFTGAFLSGSDIQGSNLEHATYAYAESDKVVDWKQKADIDIQVEKTEINDKGHPAVKLKVIEESTPIQPVMVGAYQVTGTVSLDGDIAIIDNSQTLIESDITLDMKKNMEANAKVKLGNVLASLKFKSISGAEIKDAHVSIESDLGAFSVETKNVKQYPDGSIQIIGDVSTDTHYIDKAINDERFVGNLSLGFILTLRQRHLRLLLVQQYMRHPYSYLF